MVRIRRVELLRALGTLGLVLLVLAGCGGNSGEGAGSGVSHLTLQVATPDQLPSRSVLVAASPGQPRQVETSLTRLVVSVTGEGIAAPIIADCPIPGPITAQCRSVTETADEIIVRIELTVPKGNKRQITVTAFRGNCILAPGVLHDEITVDLIRDAESRMIFPRPVTGPAEPSSLENRTFIFKDGAAFELEGAETTLTVGTFIENTAPFRLTSQSFMASGHVTIPANVTTASCDFAVESSTFPDALGPSGEALIPIEPCGIAVVDGRLVAFNAAMIKPVECFISDPPSRVVADLAVAKLDTPDPVPLGAPVTYTITVTNNGPSPATGVTLTDPLPAGVTFTTPASSQGSCAATAGTIICNLGTLTPHGSATVTLGVTPTSPGTLTNTVTVTGAEPDPDATNDSATATTTVMAADLAVTETDTPDPVLSGAPVTYTITVTNNGPSPATGVTLTDPLPPGVIFDSEISSPGCAVTAGLVTCAVGTLAPGASTTVTINVTVTSSAPTTRTNTVTVTGAEPDPDATNNSATVTTTVVPG